MNGINEKSMVDGEEQGGRVGELCSRSEPPDRRVIPERIVGRSRDSEGQ